jgi:NAD+ diphosphatase
MLHRSSARLPVWRSELDRDVPTRLRPDAVPALLADASTRVLVVRRGSALVDGGALALVPVDRLPRGAVETADAAVYLGRTLTLDAPEPVGTPLVAVAVSQDVADAMVAASDNSAHWANLRAFGATASRRDTELLAQAIALINWHASHGFSPRTGAPTQPEQAGWVRRGVDPDHDIYPRIDPSVIVAVLDDDDRILLGSNAMWDENRFSLLAGFVEPGESLEGAVEREIFEESGIRVTDAHYVGSQPWPFPASLMLGFTARVDPDAESVLRPDGEEIMEVRWFSRDELAGALDEIILPGRASIARAIIELWYGGELADGSAVGRAR